MYTIGDSVVQVSQWLTQPCVITNTGNNRIYLGNSTSLSPLSAGLVLLPRQSMNWASGNLWAVCASGETSALAVLYDGGVTFSPLVNIDGPVDINGEVAVTGPVEVNGSVGIDGPVTVNGEVGIDGMVNVYGNVGVDGPVTVNRDVGIDGTVNVLGTVSVQNIVDVRGDVSVNGPVTVNGSVGINGDVAVHGEVSIDGPVTVTGTVDAEISGPVTVTGTVDAEISGPVDISGPVTVQGGVTALGGSHLIYDNEFPNTVTTIGLDVRQFASVLINVQYVGTGALTSTIAITYGWNSVNGPDVSEQHTQYIPRYANQSDGYFLRIPVRGTWLRLTYPGLATAKPHIYVWGYNQLTGDSAVSSRIRGLVSTGGSIPIGNGAVNDLTYPLSYGLGPHRITGLVVESTTGTGLQFIVETADGDLIERLILSGTGANYAFTYDYPDPQRVSTLRIANRTGSTKNINVTDRTGVPR